MKETLNVDDFEDEDEIDELIWNLKELENRVWI